MSIKAILAAASGGTASNGAIELACQFARRFGAHVEGFHAKADPQDLVTYGGADLGISMTNDFLDRFASDTAAVANRTKQAFLATIARHEIELSTAPAGSIPPRSGCSASWREDIGFASTLVARRARFFDLTVLGRSERVIDQPYSDAIEQTLLHSGRPVLLAPAVPPSDTGGAVAVGWNGSAEAVRALVAALPFLATAPKAYLITIGDKHHESVASALEYLAWHDIAAKHRHVPTVARATPGQQLLGEARDIGADFLVIGGYSRMPWREFLFGGATSELVGISLLPLLLAH